jgi:hypothetical protein
VILKKPILFYLMKIKDTLSASQKTVGITLVVSLELDQNDPDSDS